jgi:hypothetical protein
MQSGLMIIKKLGMAREWIVQVWFIRPGLWKMHKAQLRSFGGGHMKYFPRVIALVDSTIIAPVPMPVVRCALEEVARWTVLTKWMRLQL